LPPSELPPSFYKVETDERPVRAPSEARNRRGGPPWLRESVADPRAELRLNVAGLLRGDTKTVDHVLGLVVD
jgi:hypothetical protein